MRIICTYCSSAKRQDGGLLPAVQRYSSQRIVGLSDSADIQGLEFLILSGKFGLIGSANPIPLYDHLLEPREVDQLSNQVASTLSTAGIREMEYHTAAPELFPAVRPYLSVVEAACDRASVALRVVILEGNPV